MKKLSLLMLAAYAVMLAGCNTFEGFGRDVEHVGNKIEQKADDRR